MKNIPHYKDQEICNRDMPSLRDPQNTERIRKAQDKIKQLVDSGRWRDSRWYEAFTERFFEEVKKCKVLDDPRQSNKAEKISTKPLLRRTIIALNNFIFSFLDKLITWEKDSLGYNIIAKKRGH